MRNLLGNCALFVITFGLYYALQMMDLEQNALLNSGRLFRACCLAFGLACVRKSVARASLRIFISQSLPRGGAGAGEYLYVRLSLLLSAWLLAEIFNIRLAPMIAGSAVASIVLGLALQDALKSVCRRCPAV